ncbi:MAG: Rpn family recombination-promoting nuclease/putative transposase [Prevotellaceae bacterium]|jgi:predicted transposase/invertase (TIGR01784 family)|nr:Rpn family recombination-promoting nuclease/putative transposase [Prevotellaceae bacterium]
MKYLDPKADLTFKRVFGEHPDLVMSFLNALLPLEEGEEIVEIEYIPAELMKDSPLHKNSIVDVRCRDNRGWQFLVEMQMSWTPSFQQRVLFNASKAYVRQIGKGQNYELLKPVYSLNLINAVYQPDIDEYYHHYRIVHTEHPEKVIEGLQFVFIELPKYKPNTFSDKKMKALWLRYLKEIDSDTYEIAPDLLENPEIKKAIDIIQASAYTEAQLWGYDDFWDSIRVEGTFFADGKKEGIAIGEARSQAKVEAAEAKVQKAEAKAEEAKVKAQKAEADIAGLKAKLIHTAEQLKATGVATDIIMNVTGLSHEEIEKL